MSDNGVAKFVDLIRDLVKEEIGKTDSTIVCKVVEKKREGAYDYTYDLYVEPDETNVITGIQNASNSDINEGDYVYVYKINNQLNNCFIFKKIGKIGASAYVSILEDKISTLVTKNDFATSITQTAEEINLKASRADMESEISQTAEKIDACVKKVDANGEETFGWNLTVENGFIVYHKKDGENKNVIQATADGLVIEGTVTATGGYIGNGVNGFTISDTAIWNGISSFETTSENGIYLGVDGIRLGPNFYVDREGNVTAKTLRTIDSVEIKYAVTTSLVDPETIAEENWKGSLTELTINTGDYVWTRRITKYSNETEDKEYTVSREGSDGTSVKIKGTVNTYTELTQVTGMSDGDGYIVQDASDDTEIPEGQPTEGVLYTYSTDSSAASHPWVYCGQIRGPKGETGDSPYRLDVENDFDSVPCTNAGEPHYIEEEWISETTHYVRPYYGFSRLKSFTLQASSTPVPSTGFVITYTTYGVPSGSYFPSKETEVVSESNVEYISAYITGMNSSVDNASVEYNLYQNGTLVATAKFEATKQKVGDTAIDYHLTWSASSFKKNPDDDTITPTKITIGVEETQGAQTPVSNPSYCHYKYKYDSATEWTTPEDESFPFDVYATDMVSHSSITIGVWVDLTKTGTGTYQFWEAETIEVMSDGKKGEDGDPATDYSLESSGTTFKESSGGGITPDNIVVHSKKSSGGTITEDASETYYTLQYNTDTEESAKASFPATIYSTSFETTAKPDYVIVRLYVKQSDESYIQWKSLTINKLQNGTDGLGSYTLDLSNDSAYVTCSNDGSTIYPTTGFVTTTVASVYYGGAVQTDWTISPPSTLPEGIRSITSQEVSEGIQFTIILDSFVEGTTSTNVVFTATYTGSEGSKASLAKTFVFSQLRGGDPGTVYYMECPPGAISKGSSGYTPTSFTVRTCKSKGTDIGQTITNSKFRLMVDDGTPFEISSSSGSLTIYLDSDTEPEGAHVTPNSKLLIEAFIPLSGSVPTTQIATQELLVVNDGEAAAVYSISMPSSIGRAQTGAYNPSSFTAILYKTVGSSTPVQAEAYLSLFIDGVEQTAARVKAQSMTVNLGDSSITGYYAPTETIKIVAYDDSSRSVLITSTECSVNTVVTFDNICDALGVTTEAQENNGLYWDGTNTKLLINATGIKAGVLQVGDAPDIRFLANKDSEQVQIGGFTVTSSKLSIGTDGAENSIVLQSSDEGYQCYKSTNTTQTSFLSVSTMKISDNRSGTLTQSKHFSIYVRSQLSTANVIKVSILNPTEGSSGSGAKSNWFSKESNIKQIIAGSTDTSFDLSNYTQIEYEFGTTGEDYIYIAFLKYSSVAEDSLGFVLVPQDDELLVSENGDTTSYFGFSRYSTGDISTVGAHLSLGQNFYVSKSGALTASSGTIGGFTIAENSLVCTNSGASLTIGDQTNGYFHVDENGVLEAIGATINGNINADRITFSNISVDSYIQGSLSGTGDLVNFTCTTSVNTTSTTDKLTVIAYRKKSDESYYTTGSKTISYSIYVTGKKNLQDTSYVGKQIGTTITFANGSYTSAATLNTGLYSVVLSGYATLTPSSMNISEGSVEINTHFLPAKPVSSIYNAFYDLGSAVHRWRDFYQQASSSVASDRKLKNSINYNLGDYSDFFDKLKPASFKYNDGTSNRIHLGLIAQDMEEAMESTGISSQNFAGLVKSLIDKNNGKSVEELTDEDYIYLIRYGELQAMEIYEIQQLKTKIKELEQQLKEAKGE